MVNELRLSPLSALPAGVEGDVDDGAPGAGPHPFALASFSVLGVMFLMGVGLQFFGDPYGGSARVSLDVTASDNAVPEHLSDTAVLPALEETQHEALAAIDPQDVQIITIGQTIDAAPTHRVRQPPPGQANVQLAAAPVPELLGEGEFGPIPVIGPDGERPAEVYARPFADPENLPRVALVIGGLGLNAEATQRAIETLPGEITLSFVPYADNLQRWIDAAREHGHEVIIEVPLEPFDYPQNDPGPATLLTSSDWADNASRLAWVMSRAAGYVGVMNYQGARMTANAGAFAPVLQEIAGRGLIFLDDGTSPRSLTGTLSRDTGGAWAVASRRIDLRRRVSAVRGALAGLEETATAEGVAIGVGFAYPVTLEQILTWTDTLAEKGIMLAPLSAAAQSEAG